MKNHQETEANDIQTARSNAAVKNEDLDNVDCEEKLTEYDHQPVLFDRWLHLKCVLVFFMFVFWAFAIVANIMLADFSGTDSDFNKGYIYTFAELTVPEAQEFVECWFLATFVFSTLINFIRIIVIALLAPIRAHQLFEKEQKIQEKRGNDKEPSKEFKKEFEEFHKKSLCNNASCQTCCFIPPESVEIALDVLYTIKIEEMR